MQPYPAAGIGCGVSAVDCQRQVRTWRFLRFLMELLIPSCNNCTSIEEEDEEGTHFQIYHRLRRRSFTSSTITGTIFGYRRGKVSFCIQKHPKSAVPSLLLELAVPTTILAKEMRRGTLRIVLECKKKKGTSFSLLSVPTWIMYCNGKKVGMALKRQPSKADVAVLRFMESVSVSAGIISGKEINHDQDIMYLRGEFERGHASVNSESFHLIDPEGGTAQELSIFFLRSPMI